MWRWFKAGPYIFLGLLLPVLLGLAAPAEARPLEVQASLLNVRTGSGINHGILTQVARGTVLTAVAEEENWARVILPDGKQGWVASRYTALFTPERYAVVNVNLLNVRSGPGTNHSILTQLPRHKAVPVLAEQNSWLRVLLPEGGQGWLAGWFTDSAPFRGYVHVTAARLNFRSGPGTGHAILDGLPRGELLAVLARQNGWLRVARLDGTVGWVWEQYTAPAGGGSAPASPLAGKVIVIDPGHGGPDPGAVGVTGYFEKTVNLAVALELAPMLRDAGARVLLTRWSDWNPTLWQRVDLANSNRADAFVSIHANAHPQSWVSGTETYYYPWNANASSSRALAENLQNRLVAALGLRNIGVKTANFYVIRNTHMPSALVELAFLSNWNDEALLRRPETHRRAAEAIFRGLEDFFR